MVQFVFKFVCITLDYENLLYLKCTEQILNFKVYSFLLVTCFTVDLMLPPTLEPSISIPPVTNLEDTSEPPALKPVDLEPEKSPKKMTHEDKMLTTSLLQRLSSEPQAAQNSIVVATSVLTEPAGTNNRRTTMLFRRSKSVSPQKPLKAGEASLNYPQLGTNTFLSVVIPRLETLLQHRKRVHSGDSENEDEEECPLKRFGTGK